MTDIGQNAPKFSLPDENGNSVSLDDFAGKTLVLFLYPRDNTSGCTAEARDFSALLPAFQDAGAAVLGVSKDSVKSHASFVAKHGLDVTLLSDAQGDLCETLGVWVEKNMYGRKFMGVQRTTFVINAQGIISHVWHRVRVPGHAQAVLATVSKT
jgi:thioredoxin-dependent peroxiredoxin